MTESFKQTDIGLIPEDWEQKELGELCEVKNGYAFKSEDYVDEGILNFRVINIRDFGKIDVGVDLKYLPNDFAESYDQYLLKEGDILLVMVGATRGKLGMIKSIHLPALMNQNMWRIFPKDEQLYKFYAYFFLIAAIEKFLSKYSENARGFFKKDEFRSIKIPLPPLTEQKKIAHVLSKIQQTIETQEQIIKTTQELKKALMQKLFTEGLNSEPQKQTEIGPIPESWELKKIKDFAELVTKGSSPRWQGFEYQDKGVKFVRSQNIGNGYIIYDGIAYLPIKFNEIQKRSILKENDLLINLVGASIGRVAVAPKSFENSNVNQAVGLARFEQTEIDPRFIMYYLLTKSGQWQIKKQEKDIARANISLIDVNNFLFPYTSYEEQKKISHLLDNTENKIDHGERLLFVLKDFFNASLNKLMTGQIRVKDIEFNLEELEYN